VLGTLIITLGRSTAAQSRSAAAMVPAVSWASVGGTSSDTVPSPLCSALNIGANASQAACTSATISASTIASVDRPRRVSARMSSS